MNFNHPSLKKFKPEKPYVKILNGPCYIPSFNDDNEIETNCGTSGIVRYSKSVRLNLIKLREAPNSAVAGLDVSIHNVSFIKQKNLLDDDFTILFDATLPTFDQGESPLCAILPFLTKIQSHINVPIDWAQFIKCLPGDKLNSNVPDGLIQAFKLLEPTDNDRDKLVVIAHIKLFNLLFSGECYPISKPLNNIEKCSESGLGLPVSSPTLLTKNECNSECSDVIAGITIKTGFIPREVPIKTAADLHDIFKKMGPRSIILSGKDFKKHILITRGLQTWDSLRGKTTQELDELLDQAKIDPELRQGSHAVTLIKSEGPDANGNYILTLRDSYPTGNPPSYDFQITWQDPGDLNLEPDDPSNLPLHVFSNYCVIKVKSCEHPDTNKGTNLSCLNQKCKDLGYDYFDPNAEECPCKCKEVTNNLGLKVQKTFCHYHSICECPVKNPVLICGINYNPKKHTVEENDPNCDCLCIPPTSTLQAQFKKYTINDLYPCSGADFDSLIAVNTSVPVKIVSSIKLV